MWLGVRGAPRKGALRFEVRRGAFGYSRLHRKLCSLTRGDRRSNPAPPYRVRIKRLPHRCDMREAGAQAAAVGHVLVTVGLTAVFILRCSCSFGPRRGSSSCNATPGASSPRPPSPSCAWPSRCLASTPPRDVPPHRVRPVRLRPGGREPGRRSRTWCSCCSRLLRVHSEVDTDWRVHERCSVR